MSIDLYSSETISLSQSFNGGAATPLNLLKLLIGLMTEYRRICGFKNYLDVKSMLIYLLISFD
jgi:hypothetical protein